MSFSERIATILNGIWNCLKGNIGETSERRGGAHMGFSGRIDTISN